MPAIFGGVGTPELVLILVIALLLFGAKRLPGLVRSLGKSLKEFKKATKGISDELEETEEEIKEAIQKPDDNVGKEKDAGSDTG